MKLELGLFNVENVIPNERTYLQGRTLFVDLNELRQIIAADHRFSKIEIDIVHPGDPVRLINVLDVIEPRIKVEGGKPSPAGLEEWASQVWERLTHSKGLASSRLA